MQLLDDPMKDAYQASLNELRGLASDYFQAANGFMMIDPESVVMSDINKKIAKRWLEIFKRAV